MKRSIIDLVRPGSKVVFKNISEFVINSNNEKIVFTVDSIDKNSSTIRVCIAQGISVYKQIDFNISDIEAMVKEPSDSNYTLHIGDRVKLKNTPNAYELRDKDAEVLDFIRHGRYSDDHIMIRINNTSYQLSKDIITYKILHKYDDIFPSQGDSVLVSKDLKYTRYYFGISENMKLTKDTIFYIKYINDINAGFLIKNSPYEAEYSYHPRDIIKICKTNNDIINSATNIGSLISYY